MRYFIDEDQTSLEFHDGDKVYPFSLSSFEDAADVQDVGEHLNLYACGLEPHCTIEVTLEELDSLIKGEE